MKEFTIVPSAEGIESAVYIQGYSTYCVITDNVFMNFLYGVRLDQSSSNIVADNKMINNSYGLVLLFCSNTNVSRNTVIGNIYGIYLGSSSSNLIVHNNIIDNTDQAYVYESSAVWDNGCEGNYWSGYSGLDLDSDGVGDQNLPCEEVDYYPLMNPYWNIGDINHDLKVDLKDVYKTATAYGSMQGGDKWNPHCDINNDGKVDLKDYYTVSKNYGKTYR